eukprot:1501502-Rhodomonas_salina.2
MRACSLFHARGSLLAQTSCSYARCSLLAARCSLLAARSLDAQMAVFPVRECSVLACSMSVCTCGAVPLSCLRDAVRASVWYLASPTQSCASVAGECVAQLSLRTRPQPQAEMAKALAKLKQIRARNLERGYPCPEIEVIKDPGAGAGEGGAGQGAGGEKEL